MKVLKFGAIWCNGCLVMKPRWAELEAENPWLKTEFYDYDADKEMVETYNISEELPTFVFLDKDGKEFLRLHGEIKKEELQRVITENKER